MNLKVLGAVEQANDAQKHVLTHKIKRHFGTTALARTTKFDWRDNCLC